MVTAHRLVVIRHAKAEPVAPSDVERALTEQGRADAAAAGRLLAAAGVSADAALVSPATRTRQTWQVLADAAGWTTEPQVEQSLYSADEDTVLDLVGETEESVGTLVVVGHNPTMGSLAHLLDDGDGDPAATTRLLQGYSTSAVAVFDLPVGWAGVGRGSGRLALMDVGRG
ncbi:histidine phosphatase family protein [Nocardioides sp. TF02-7]|nr:histidine phosphatase family protein [Nocardioides sp. TF02-7]UMG92447.1 histidine phosphatase family protein [Nocardioides sp. TF02-7]